MSDRPLAFGTVSELTAYLKRARRLFWTERTTLSESERILSPGGPPVIRADGPWTCVFVVAVAADGTIEAGEQIEVPTIVFDELSAKLGDDKSDVRRLSTWPIQRVFLYLDVSDFSTREPLEQALAINDVIRHCEARATRLNDGELEARLCIGDGYIFVLTDAVRAIQFAASVAQTIEVARAKGDGSRLHYRMGMHFGPVLCFVDPGRGVGGDWNYIGTGINGGKRVLDAIGKDQDDVIFVSGELRDEVYRRGHTQGMPLHILSNLQNRGRRRDKHANWWRVYELGHVGMGVGGSL